MNSVTLCLSWIGILAMTVPVHAQPLGFAADGVEQCRARANELADGDVLYVEREPYSGAGVALTACGVIEAPPDTVWPALRDCGEYDEFLPGVTESALKGRENNVARCEARIDLPFPLGDLRSIERATETELNGGGYERRWTLERGDYQRLEGSWTLLPEGADAQRTIAVYQLDMDPETPVPDFLLRRTQSTTARSLFTAIRERVR